MNDLNLKIEKNYLCFDKFVKYKLMNPRKYKIKEHFTVPQKEALMKIMIGLLAERPILLTGDIGTGKTFIVEQLANLIGANLKVIQFNSETTSMDIIGKLELTIDKEKINSLNASIKNFIKMLIKEKYEKITEIIVESELLDIPKIKTFLETEVKSFLKYGDDVYNEFINLKLQINTLSGIKKTHFNFQLSALVKAMKEGDWVLLDDINFAPQEIEGLMSLLEEEPTLKIYENDPPLFFTKDKTKIKNKNTDFEIHPNFRLIMTTSKDTNISIAIKSRCLCIQIKPFKEPRDYGELIANNLKYSDIADKNIIDIAKKIGYSFYKLKEDENKSNYILKNYILSSVNLVNLSKLIIFCQPIDDKKLARIIEFSIFSAYKNLNKESFKKNLQENIKLEINPIKNIKKSHEYYLKQCELIIFSYYYIKNKEGKDIIKSMNEKIKNINYKAEIKQKIINEDIQKVNLFKEIPRKNLLDNLDSFTLPEIREYINDIDEVIKILKEFLEEKDELYQQLYFLFYLRKFLYDLSSIDNDKLNGIKLKKMECNKEFFLKYNIKETLSEKYAKILIRSKNLIYYFNDIIPQKISILEFEKSIIAIYYKYYKKEYENQIKTYENFENYFPFLLLANSSLKIIMKKWNFPNLNKNLKELYNILKYYNGSIEVNIIKKEIYIERYMLTIPLNKNVDIHNIDQIITIENNEIIYEIDFYVNEIDEIIIYYYPKQFYNEENILQLIFFFDVFIKELLIDIEIKKIFPDELSNYNFAINYYLNRNKFFNDMGQKTISYRKYNFIDIIKIGYQLFEVTSEIRKDSIKLKSGINLIDDNTMNDNEKKISKVIKYIELINKYLNDEKLHASMKNKYEILQNKRKGFIIQKKKSQLMEDFNNFKNTYENILSNNDYKFLTEESKKIEEQINNNNDNNKEIKKNIEILKNKLLKVQNSQIQNEKEDNRKSENIFINKSGNILYTYSKLYSIIEEFKNIKLSTIFINRVIKFQKLIKQYQKKIDIISGYKEKIFSECENEQFVSQETIEIFQHMANAYLISEVVKNNLEEKFNIYIDNIFNLNAENINEIKKIFNEEDYMYFPKLSIKDIIYCFRYGEDGDDNYKSGELNPVNKAEINIKKVENIKRVDYINDLKNSLRKIIKDENKVHIAINYLDKISILYDKIENKEYNIIQNWLVKPLEMLKGDAVKYPNRVILKSKFENEKIFEIEKCKGKIRIISKTFFILLDGNKKIETIFGQTNILNKIISDIQNFNKMYLYGYRILGFYDFHLFEDDKSKTMIIILKTIHSKLKNLIDEIPKKEVIKIAKDIYKNFIDFVLSSKSPNFEDTNIFKIFQIIYFSFLKKFIIKYKEIITIYETLTKKTIESIKSIKNQAQKKYDEEKSEYEKKNKNYNEKTYQRAKEFYTMQNEDKSDNIFLRGYNYFNKVDLTNKSYHEIIQMYERESDYNIMRMNGKLPDKPHYLDYWNILVGLLKDIESHLNRLKMVKEFSDIQNYINKIKPLIINIKSKYIEENDKTIFIKLYNEIKNISNYIFNMNQANMFLEQKFPDNIKIYEDIQENDLYFIYNIILKFKDYLQYDSLFKIAKISINKKNINIYNYISNYKYNNNNFNFIFTKSNNKPIFLYKQMKINLGLYILGSESKNIGSFSIKNNFGKIIKYSINQDPNNEIIIYVDEKKELNPFNDLILNFKLNIQNQKSGFYSSKFDLILLNENKEIDKCIVYVFINLIPFIIKISIPNEKYSLINNKISISHNIEKLTINHSFPGNYHKRLDIRFLHKNIYLEQNNTDGQIIIKPKNYEEDIDKIKFEFALSLSYFSLLNFTVNYINVQNLGLKIFNSRDPDLKNIDIMKETKRSLYLFNMSNNDIYLNYDNNNEGINIISSRNKISSGQTLKIEIENLQTQKISQFNINDKKIIIKNIPKPSIGIIQSKINFNWNPLALVDREYLEQFHLISIEKNFSIKNYKINGNFKMLHDSFSLYFLFNNKIIDYKKMKYKFENITCQEIYGFSDEKFGLFKYNDNNIKIILSIKIYTFDYYRTIFNEHIRTNFMKKLKENLKNLNSTRINEINKGISNIINQNVNISNINTIENLNISNDKTSFENIIKFLLKYFLNKSVDELKKNLQEIFNQIYIYSKREIKKYFISKIIDEKTLINLDKFSYILSFVHLILSPGELLEYEYNVEKNLILKDFIGFENYKKHKTIYDDYIKSIQKDKILNKELIYYNGKITLHEENDEFSKYENQIRENLIKIEEQNEEINKEGNKEFITLCFNQIKKIISDIDNNNINISNLYSFLDSCKEVLMKYPIIISNKENEDIIKEYVNDINYIKNYLLRLSQTNIFNTEFKDIIYDCYIQYGIFDKKMGTFDEDYSSTNIHFDFPKKMIIIQIISLMIKILLKMKKIYFKMII